MSSMQSFLCDLQTDVAIRLPFLAFSRRIATENRGNVVEIIPPPIEFRFTTRLQAFVAAISPWGGQDQTDTLHPLSTLIEDVDALGCVGKGGSLSKITGT